MKLNFFAAKQARRPIRYAWAAGVSAVLGMLIVSEGANTMRWAPVLDAVVQVLRSTEQQQQRQAELLQEQVRDCADR